MRGAFGFQIWNSAAAFHGVPAMFTAGWNVMEKAFDPVFWETSSCCRSTTGLRKVIILKMVTIGRLII